MKDNVFTKRLLLCSTKYNAGTMHCVKYCSLWTLLLCCIIVTAEDAYSEAKSNQNHGFRSEFWGNYHSEKWRSFPDSLRLECKEAARKMFYFGYDSYMKYAFPQDELNPIACSGRGPDVLNP